MTTSNRIITQTIDEGLYIPLEALHSQYDSITYVYKKQGGSTTKQEVMLGEANTEYVVIMGGLSAEDQLSLSTVDGMEDEEIELLTEMNGKRMQKEESVPEPEPLQPQQGERRRKRPNS